MDKKITILKDLSMLNGIPGYEKEVSSYIKKNISTCADELSYDNLGSLIAKKGKGEKVMIAAHMDEVGLMVTDITKEGFIKFTTLGGWFSQVMLAEVWQIKTNNNKTIIGVTGCKPPHLIPLDKRKEAIPIEAMFLDIGVNSKEEALKLGVELGNMITPYIEFKELGSGEYYLGKAFDDRIGCAVVIGILEGLDKNPNTLYAAFTTQEEVGVRGAKTTSYIINPKIAFAIDSGVGNDVVGGDLALNSQVKLGAGPQIHLSDAGLIAHQGLRKFVIDVAKELGIPYQEPYLTGGRTDAAMMHMAHDGAAALSIGIPTRYMHSHTSVVNKTDYLNTIKLMIEVIKRLDEKKIKEILEY